MAFEDRTAASDDLLGRAVFTDADRDDWCDDPIDPSWVRAGRPLARSIVLARGVDGCAMTAFWECTEGTFEWQFHWDETVHVLDGIVDVTMSDGCTRRLAPGSVAFFPAGSRALWSVIEPVRKLAVCRRALPLPLARSLALVGEARTVARKAKQGMRHVAARLADVFHLPSAATATAAGLLVAGTFGVFALDLV